MIIGYYKFVLEIKLVWQAEISLTALNSFLAQNTFETLPLSFWTGPKKIHT